MGSEDAYESVQATFDAMSEAWAWHDAQIVRFLPGGTAIVVTESATILPGEAAAPPDRQHLVTWLLTRHDDRWLVEANHMCQV